MKPKTLLRALEEAVQQLGVRVRYERGGFRGGYCVVDDEAFVMLNKRHPPEVHLAVLAESLRALPIDTIYLRPAVRDALEDLWARQTPDDADTDPDAE